MLFASVALIAVVLSVMLVGACAREGSGRARSQEARHPKKATGFIDPTELAALVDPVFAAGMKEERIPGAAFVLVQNGRVVLSKGFGLADVASGRPVRPDSMIFPFASISKVFTATAVMQLAEQGRIDLDTDVNRYLKSVRVPPTYPRPVTIAHLLTHTSGLDELPGRRVRDAAELVPLGRFLAGRLIRVHAPGEVTSYSSYGMALAGLLVEDVSGQPFEEYLRLHIWKPLGLQVDDSNGRRIIEHGGDIGGFSALMTLLPDEDVGIFVAHHLESRNLRFDVRQAILDRYFPDRRPRKAPAPQPKTAGRLTRFAGTYRANIFCHSCSDGGPNVQDFEVKANDDGTISLWDTRWVEVSPLYFVGLDGRRRIGFSEDGSGRIVAVTAGAWRVLERVR